jgi:XTP/dITP diphosphohydrolase
MKLIFATNNEHKIQEIRHAVGNGFELLTLKEAGIDIDIPEPHATIEENASEKSRVIYEMTRTNCFSEDTGLEIAALNGEPGVHSARYAGDERSFEKNIDKVLSCLAPHADRSARFRTVISLILDGRETLFEGICNGRILHERKGKEGFGYDPVFVPDGATLSFAEMTLAEKDQFSHRAKATAKLIAFLASATPFEKSLETKTKT